ncbi:hypothetical protein G4B88_000501 [Cannabis sativa]|uniref:Adaptor AP-1 19 kDa protein n=2 Tax=Cannabis sativa TaxID=3483 RepID=A0A7J6EPV4_CANSA|nr:hypothetical protein G4B88_000501 [Cannabis sativa]
MICLVVSQSRFCVVTIIFYTCIWIPLLQLKKSLIGLLKNIIFFNFDQNDYEINNHANAVQPWLPISRYVDLKLKSQNKKVEEEEEEEEEEEALCSICLVDFEKEDVLVCGVELWWDDVYDKNNVVQFEKGKPSSSSRSLQNLEEMIHFVLLISRQGKVRLTKWYSPYSQKERTKVLRELSGVILTRGPKLCNFVEWRGYKVVYKRYASLYFCMCIDQEDNELEVLEIIHHYVEILDRYFGSVCELDLIFNFHKAYYILDELLIAGELQESSKKTVARLIAAQDSLVETAKEEASSISNIIAQATK